MTLRLSSKAESEYGNSSLYYLEASPSVAVAFIEEIEEALGEITDYPERYPYYKGNVRVRVLTHFPFSIFYRVIADADEVLVISISHQSRKPEHWVNRL